MDKKPELNPLENERPDIHPRKHTAAGIPAILSSMNHAFREAGIVRGTRELFRINQKRGYDCPGCAWPDPDDHRSMTEFCENGAKAIAEEGTTLRADPNFFKVHSVAELARWSDFHIGKSGRLTHPMVLKENGTHYEPISWQGAFDLIAEELAGLSSPDEAAFYTSGRTSNEAAFAYQLFVRAFGTNNLPDCSNMCHESSTVGLTDSIGIGKGSVTLNDFDEADCILVIGQNPGTNHPRMLTALGRASEKGAKIISINPLFETGLDHFIHPQHFWRWFGRGTPISCLHLPIRVNGDIAVLKGIMKELLILEEENPGHVFDHKFIREKTDGYDEFLAELRSSSWDVILEQAGVSRENIRAAAEVIAKSKRMIACWAMGITQQAHGVHAIREIVNLLLLGGHFGRPGAGCCPVRGHSNVQGDRTVGIYEKPSDEFLANLGKEFLFTPRAEHGLDAVETTKAMYRGDVKVFFGMGGNFLSAMGDTDFIADAFRKTRLTVHVSTKPNRSHLVHGRRALILPAIGRTEIDQQASGEQFVTVEDSMSVVHMSHGHLKPGRDQQKKSEVAIVCGLAETLFAKKPGPGSKISWRAMTDNYDVIRDHIEAVVPGFKDYNQRVRVPGGFYLPHSVRDSAEFHTSTRKGRFCATAIPPMELPEKGLMLMTLRSHDQFNTTIYGLHDRYRGVNNGRRVIFMNEADITERGLKHGDWVDITSHHEDTKRSAPKWMVVKYDIPRRCAAAYYPEANVLVPIASTVHRSNTPTYKSIVITVEACTGEGTQPSAGKKADQAQAPDRHLGQSRDQVHDEEPNPHHDNLASRGSTVTSGRNPPRQPDSKPPRSES